MSYVAPKPVPYRGQAQTNAQPGALAGKTFPLPEDCPIQLAAWAMAQDFEMRADSFPPSPKNTPLTTFFSAATYLTNAHAILTKYSAPSPSNAILIKANAQFNIVPATWSDFKFAPFTFPGFPGFVGDTTSRSIFTDTVVCRQQMDYYVLDPDGVLNGGTPISAGTAPVTAAAVQDSGGTLVKLVGSLQDIPKISKSLFYVAAGGTTVRTNSIVPAGGKAVGSLFYYETMPTLANYQTMAATAAGSGAGTGWLSSVWGGTNTVTGQGQLVIEDSRLEIFAGNIVARVSTYVLIK